MTSRRSCALSFGVPPFTASTIEEDVRHVTLRPDRGGDSRVSGRPPGHHRRRRGPGERGRPVDRGRAGHAGAHQLHGHPRPRADLPVDDRGALRPARAAADGARTTPRPTAPRSPSRSRPRARSRPASPPPTGRRPSARRSTRRPGRRICCGPGHVFPLRAAKGGRAQAHRADRGVGRPGDPGRADAGGGDLRDDERRRHHGPGAGAGPLRRRARPQDDHRGGPDPLPPVDRDAGRAGRLAPAADRLRRLPDPRLPLQGHRGGAPGAGHGGRSTGGGRAGRWCGSTASA